MRPLPPMRLAPPTTTAATAKKLVLGVEGRVIADACLKDVEHAPQAGEEERARRPDEVPVHRNARADGGVDVPADRVGVAAESSPLEREGKRGDHQDDEGEEEGQEAPELAYARIGEVSRLAEKGEELPGRTYRI